MPVKGAEQKWKNSKSRVEEAWPEWMLNRCCKCFNSNPPEKWMFEMKKTHKQ
jgi:hypothetical protein